MPTELVAAPPPDSLHFIAKPTPQLRASLNQHEATLPPAEFADLLSHVRSAFEKYTAKLLEFRVGSERGTALHQMMDKELKAASGLPVSCRQGCSGCCHYEVEITKDEAEILKTIVLEGFPIDHDLLEHQAARPRMSSAWRRFWSPQNRCVFLGHDGGCKVYEERPAICRKHLVVSPPNACTTAGAAVAPVQVLMAEILLSAAVSIEGATFASLPKMLRAELYADARQRTPAAWVSTSTGRSLPPSRATPRGFVGRPPLE